MNQTNSRKIITLLLTIAVTIPIFAQIPTSVVNDNARMPSENRMAAETPEIKITKPDEPKISPELEAKLVKLLKTTGKDAAALNMPENRIRYQADAADLLWAHDEKAARDMFANAANDLRGLVQSLDTFYQQREAGEVEDDSFGGMMFGGGRGGSAKFYTTNTIRQNLLLAWAERDGAATLALFRETQRDNYKEFGWNDGQFEAKLASLIAKNDPAQALEMGMQKLSKGNFEGIDDLISNLYRKDADKGAKLAAEAVKSFSTADSTLKNNYNNYYGQDPITSLFSKAAQSAAQKSESSADKPPMLSDADLSQLAEVIIKKRAERFKQSGDSYYYGSSDSSEYLKKYAPASYARFEREANRSSNSNSMLSNANSSMGNIRVRSNVNSNITISSMNSNTSATVGSSKISARESAEQAQSEAISKLTQAAMSPDAKISLEEARKSLSQIHNRQQKLLALTQIAKVFVARGDKDSAKSLLSDVAGMQSAQPRKAMEMLQNLMLADAYSGVEPDRSFTIMESTIFEFNSVAAALNRMVDFVDFKEFADGEFNMGMIPREALQFAGTVGLRQPLFNLATADFERTAALADKFDKPELRMEAKMLIIRTLLPSEKE